MEGVGAAATILQLISFTGEVLLSGYGFLNKVHKAPAEIRTLLREIATLNALLDQLQSLVTDKDSSDVHVKGALDTLDKLGVFGECEKLMEVVRKGISACELEAGQNVRNLGKRILWPFKEKETKETLVQLERLRAALSAAVVVDSAQKLRNLESLASRIDTHVLDALNGLNDIEMVMRRTSNDISSLKVGFEAQAEEEEKLAIRRWLYPDSVDSDAAFTAALSVRHSGSGQWLLDSDAFKQWTGSDRDFLWLYGIAGSGKTILSATVVDHLLQTSKLKQSTVLYFFCDHRNPSGRNFQDLLYSVIKQLLDQDSECFSVARYWRDRQTQAIKGQDAVAKPLSPSEYIGLVQQLCSRWSNVNLVVDAMDECNDLDNFMGGLTALTSNKSNIRLLLTSRHDMELKRVIEPIATHEIPLSDHMEVDIDSYLRTELKSRIALNKLKLKQRNLEDSIVDALKEKADGMILIAKLQLDYICGLKSDRAIKEALLKLPSGIYETYDEILYQLCSKNPDAVEDIVQMLYWLLGSMVPLTLEELAEAISIRPEDDSLDESGIVTDLLDLAASCGSLVTVRTIETDSGLIQDLRGPRISLITLAHTSVEEYLKSGKIGRGLMDMFHMDMGAIHLKLARVCLQYVGFDDFREPMNLPRTDDVQAMKRTVFRQIPDLNAERRVLQERVSRYALVDYASRYWSDHLRQTEVPLDEDTLPLLKWFMEAYNDKQYQGKYISWQQMYHRDIVFYCPNRPPLFYAIEFRINSLIEMLTPTDVNQLIGDMAPLHVAASCGNLEAVKMFLARGASIHFYSGPEARVMTALHFAAEGGHIDVIRYLLTKGADPDARSQSLSTPFYRAARSGSLKALHLLREAGCDINTETWDHFTPLFEAVAYARVKIAAQLLEWGADPTIETDMGKQSAIKLLIKWKNERKGNQKRLLTSEDVLMELRSMKSYQEFEEYLKGLRPQIVLLEEIRKDTRPGTEREKDLRFKLDVRNPSPPSAVNRRS
ncbi:hypothetical protein F5884DRAFT_865727 [Xylogone sp. PMI_703]|nr:hypothetical protein F5884DRAFT_865727 [Xylogone sp. PMI_703]